MDHNAISTFMAGFASLPLYNHFGFFKSKRTTFRVMDVATKLEVQNLYSDIGLDPVEFGMASIAHAA